MKAAKGKPVTPGEVLEKKFLKHHDISQTDLAKSLHITRRRIHEILRGKRAITPDTALRIAKLFGTEPEYWMNLQVKIDLWNAGRDKKAIPVLKKIKTLKKKKA